MLHNIKDSVGTGWGIPVDEVVHTDDTMLVSGPMQGLQAMLWEIARRSPAYGLWLNYNKCEATVTNAIQYPKFRSGRAVPRTVSVTHLGVRTTFRGGCGA